MSKEFYTIRTTGDVPKDLMGAVATYVKNELSKYKTQRDTAEETWLEAWAAYLGTPEAVQHMRQQVLRTVGAVNDDWRHRINIGKAFESVETIHAYLMAATFPNRDWFTAYPEMPGEDNLQVAKVVGKYTSKKLELAKFRAHYENFLRQLIITGNSVMALPWRYETVKWKKRLKVPVMVHDEGGYDVPVKYEVREYDKVIANEPDFEVLDVFDVYLDPTSTDPNTGNMIRRLKKARADVFALVQNGVYRKIDLTQIARQPAIVSDEDKSNHVRWFNGIEEQSYSMADVVELYEFWGDVHLSGVTYKDVVVTLLGDTVVKFETNPYWSGRPFVWGTYIPVVRQPYAIGAIQPSLGLLHEMNIITNQRLDNLELSVDTMWTYVDDGTLPPEEIYTAPGKVFKVSDHNSLKPVDRAVSFGVSYTEEEVQERRIDKNFGTGALIGVGQGRSGERVTAEEIQAVRDAGGNRLSNIHKHIEDTSLVPMLAKVFRSMQQFVTQAEVVRVVGAGGVAEYYEVTPEALSYDMLLRPLGADHVTERKKYIEDRLQFMSVTAQYDEMRTKVNYEAILLDLIQHFGFDDPEAYLMQVSPNDVQPSPMETGQPPTPTDPMSVVRSMGGEHLAASVTDELAATGATDNFTNAVLGVQ